MHRRLYLFNRTVLLYVIDRICFARIYFGYGNGYFDFPVGLYLYAVFDYRNIVNINLSVLVVLFVRNGIERSLFICTDYFHRFQRRALPKLSFDGNAALTFERTAFVFG